MAAPLTSHSSQVYRYITQQSIKYQIQVTSTELPIIPDLLHVFTGYTEIRM
jgi:hypothetical protein